jgi:hypothetical protein
MDYRRELDNIRKHYRAYQKQHGETVVWFEFIPFGNNPLIDSMYDDVYDEGSLGAPGRRYKKGAIIPVLTVTEQEDLKRAIPEGRQPIELTSLILSVEDMRSAGILDPFEYRRHLNDMFLYDGRYFSVQTYRVRGRLKDDISVVVEGVEVYINQEMPFDVGPSPYAVQNLPWPSTLPTPPSIA